MEKQHGICCYCGQPMTLAYNGTVPFPNTATIEHLRRRADGGLTVPDNLALACHDCNSARGAMNWVEFKTVRPLQINASSVNG